MSAARRGGIPGPEVRSGLVRPSMTEAEFERQLSAAATADEPSGAGGADQAAPAEPEPAEATEPAPRTSTTATTTTTARNGRTARAKPAAKARRVQRMFAVEEELDRKLWLYAIHVGKDRSDVVNDLLRPLVGSMVLYDSRERRAGRNAEVEAEG